MSKYIMFVVHFTLSETIYSCLQDRNVINEFFHIVTTTGTVVDEAQCINRSFNEKAHKVSTSRGGLVS